MSAPETVGSLDSYNAQLYALQSFFDESSRNVRETPRQNGDTATSDRRLKRTRQETPERGIDWESSTASESPRGRTLERDSSESENFTFSRFRKNQSPTSSLYLGGQSPCREANPVVRSGAAYRYHTLPSTHIRLLCLFPGAFKTPLQCALKTVPLESLSESTIEFQALSYAWGDGSSDHFIFVREAADSDPFSLPFLPVRSNLHAALRHIREELFDTWLWVDALCIDQNNEQEKSHQIPHMPQIYSGAWNVAVWLGKSSYHGYGTRSVKYLLRHVLNLEALNTMLGSARLEEEIAHALLQFCALLQRPWFSRRWVIQEIACARRLSVRFGQSIFSWVDFMDAIELVLDHLDRLKDLCLPRNAALAAQSPLHTMNVEGLNSLLNLSRNVFRKSRDGTISSRLIGLDSLVIAASSFDVSVPQDIVYSLLYLAKDVSMDGVPVPEGTTSLAADYSKKPVDTFLDFVSHCIRTRGSLDMILHTWLSYSSRRDMHQDLPTWMQFCVPNSKQTESLAGQPTERIYDACRGTTVAASVEREVSRSSRPDNFSGTGEPTPQSYSGRLIADGVVLGQIESIATPGFNVISDQCLRLLGWEGTLDDGVPDTLWRTLVANRTHDRKSAPAWYRRACALALTQLDEDGNLDLSRLSARGAQPQTLVRYLDRVQRVIQGRSIFSCGQAEHGDEELVGFVSTRSSSPGNIRVGDYICVLFGCSLPVVLRGSLENSNIVRLFGEAYVHGHMEGELFAGKTAIDVAEMTVQFKIR